LSLMVEYLGDIACELDAMGNKHVLIGKTSLTSFKTICS